MRKSIVVYLKSKKLKKRNANFIEVFKRINDELNERNKKISSELKLNKEFEIFSTQSRSTQEINLPTKNIRNLSENKFLCSKWSFSSGFEVPSFLNDRSKKNETCCGTPNTQLKTPLETLCPSCYGIFNYIILRLRKWTFQ